MRKAGHRAVAAAAGEDAAAGAQAAAAADSVLWVRDSMKQDWNQALA